jgi:carbamoyl-phosphate synthase large subunit
MQIIVTRQGEEHSLSVIECNLRASRSFPFVSKVLDVNFIDLATRALVNDSSLKKSTPRTDIMQINRDYKAVKVPIFSWTRLAGADPFLGVEMASTGEVACFGSNIQEAFYTAQVSNHTNFKNLPLPLGSNILISGDVNYSKEIQHLSELFYTYGFNIILDSESVNPAIPFTKFNSKVFSDPLECRKLFSSLSLVISLFKTRSKESYLVRRNAVDFGVGLLNELNTSLLFAQSLKADFDMNVKSHEEYLNSIETVSRKITMNTFL